MTKHTPGPWHTEHTYPSAYSNYDWATCILDDKRHVLRIDQSSAVDKAVAEANARLIASAPDLLAALEWLTDALLYQTNKTAVDDQLDALADQFAGVFADQVQQARAAIAKARGE